MSWQTRPLAEVADFNLGKMLDQNKNRGELRPYLANVNVRWGEFQLDDLREMRFEEHELDKFGVRTGDILMCEGGEPGRCAIWTDQMPGMMFQKALHRIRPHSCLDSRFLYYSFLRKGRMDGFAGLFTGSTIKHLPKEKLAKVEITFPSLPEQQSIAATLSAYDELIDNNRRRIALLEEAARQLYKECFVRFRFPGHEHVKIIDGVPEGWELKPVAELSSFLSRGIAPVYDEEAAGLVINQKCIRDSKVDLEPARAQSKTVPEQKLVKKFDVLVNSTGAGTLGRVAQNFYERENMTVDSHVTIVRPAQNVAPTWLGLSLTSRQDYIATLGRGATNQTELSKDDIGAISLPVPPPTLLWEFEQQVTINAQMVVVLMAQNLQLAKARDLLLPRLMSGSLAT